MDASQRIAEMRKEYGISQSELARLLTEYGFPTTNKMVSSWEKGSSVPNANQYLAILDVLGSNDDVAKLNELGKMRVAEYVATLLHNPKYCRHTAKRIPLYTQSVSAGTGQWLGDNDYEWVEAKNGGADYAVRIAGDSMMPRWKDGDVVEVVATTELQVGDIGIFVVNGEVYIKVMGINQLLSLNPQYDPILISEYDSYRIEGRWLVRMDEKWMLSMTGDGYSVFEVLELISVADCGNYYNVAGDKGLNIDIDKEWTTVRDDQIVYRNCGVEIWLEKIDI